MKTRTVIKKKKKKKTLNSISRNTRKRSMARGVFEALGGSGG